MKQGIYQQSETPKYPIGLRFAKGDRVFKYCKAGNAGIKALYGAYNANVPIWFGDGAGTECVGVVNTVTVTGIPQSGAEAGSVEVAVEKDEFAGGYLVAYTTPHQCIRIKSNTKIVAGGTMTLILSDPLFAGLDGTIFTALYHNIYSKVVWPASEAGFASVVVMPLIAVSDGYYFWGQT